MKSQKQKYVEPQLTKHDSLTASTAGPGSGVSKGNKEGKDKDTDKGKGDKEQD